MRFSALALLPLAALALPGPAPQMSEKPYEGALAAILPSSWKLSVVLEKGACKLKHKISETTTHYHTLGMSNCDGLVEGAPSGLQPVPMDM